MLGKWICRNVSVFRCCTYLHCNVSSDDANNYLCVYNDANNYLCVYNDAYDYLCGYYHHNHNAAHVSCSDSVYVDRRHLPRDQTVLRLNYS